jgi:hypothetical protein
MAAQTTSAPTEIHPDSLYSAQAVFAFLGMSSKASRTKARRLGLNAKQLKLGRRAFFMGSSIIEFLREIQRQELSTDDEPFIPE